VDAIRIVEQWLLWTAVGIRRYLAVGSIWTVTIRWARRWPYCATFKAAHRSMVEIAQYSATGDAAATLVEEQ